jgi:hypothetical protein
MCPVVSRIAGDPLLIGLFPFLKFPGYVRIVTRSDLPPFPLAGTFLQLKRFGEILPGPFMFAKTDVVAAYRAVGLGQTWDQAEWPVDGKAELRQCFSHDKLFPQGCMLAALRAMPS